MAKLNREGQAALITKPQFEALMEATPTAKYRTLWQVLYWTAARVGEATQLQWGHITDTHVHYKAANTKMGRARSVPLLPALREALEAYREAWCMEHGEYPKPNEVLFPSSNSTTCPMSTQAADKMFRKVVATIDLRGATLHSFRRSMASRLARTDGIHVAKVMTGHASTKSLLPYLEATEADLIAALT